MIVTFSHDARTVAASAARQENREPRPSRRGVRSERSNAQREAAGSREKERQKESVCVCVNASG